MASVPKIDVLHGEHENPMPKRAPGRSTRRRIVVAGSTLGHWFVLIHHKRRSTPRADPKKSRVHGRFWVVLHAAERLAVGVRSHSDHPRSWASWIAFTSSLVRTPLTSWPISSTKPIASPGERRKTRSTELASFVSIEIRITPAPPSRLPSPPPRARHPRPPPSRRW